MEPSSGGSFCVFKIANDLCDAFRFRIVKSSFTTICNLDTFAWYAHRQKEKIGGAAMKTISISGAIAVVLTLVIAAVLACQPSQQTALAATSPNETAQVVETTDSAALIVPETIVENTQIDATTRISFDATVTASLPADYPVFEARSVKLTDADLNKVLDSLLKNTTFYPCSAAEAKDNLAPVTPTLTSQAVSYRFTVRGNVFILQLVAAENGSEITFCPQSFDWNEAEVLSSARDASGVTLSYEAATAEAMRICSDLGVDYAVDSVAIRKDASDAECGYCITLRPRIGTHTLSGAALGTNAWDGGRVRICIDDSGVLAFSFTRKCATTVLRENASLLSFDAILSAAKAALASTHQDANVTVTNVKLTYACVADADSSTRYLFTPVCIFYGTEQRADGVPSATVQLACVGAVDGVVY